MKNNVYVAGSWKNRYAAKCLMKDIENLGCKITVDWTVHKKRDNVTDYVKEYIKGLQECDYFIYCMDGIKSLGKNFELGYATALGKPIAIYLLSGNIFGLSIDKVPFDKIVERESVFIRSNMYLVIRTIDELKNWLLSIVSRSQKIQEQCIQSDVVIHSQSVPVEIIQNVQ